MTLIVKWIQPSSKEGRQRDGEVKEEGKEEERRERKRIQKSLLSTWYSKTLLYKNLSSYFFLLLMSL